MSDKDTDEELKQALEKTKKAVARAEEWLEKNKLKEPSKN